MPPKKIALLRAAAGAGDWRAALRIASRFPALGDAKGAVMGAWEALARPAFQRSLGRSPDALIAAGIEALTARYGLGAAPITQHDDEQKKETDRREPAAQSRGQRQEGTAKMETEKAKEGGRAESKKIAAFSAKLPARFTKPFKGKEFEIERAGENEWAVNGKKIGGIRAAMNAILEKTVGKNNGRTADNFFAAALREPKADDKAPAKAKAPKKSAAGKKAGGKKAAKKGTSSNG